MAAEGEVAVANSKGVARLPVQNFAALNHRFHVLDTRVSDDRKVTVDRVVGAPSQARDGRPLVVGLRTQRLVHWNFVDRGGREVPFSRVSLLEMRSNTGEVVRFRGSDLERPRWMAAGRTQQTPKGLVNKEQYWSVSRVVVDGGDVVNRSQQVFVPEQSQEWTVTLLFYRVQVVGRDMLFGSLAGKGVALEKPNGKLARFPFVDGKATMPSLARGTYQMHLYGPGASFTRPISISKDQLVEIEVISPVDLGLIVSLLVLIALSLLVVGRRQHLRQLGRRWRVWVAGPIRSPVHLAVVAVLCVLALVTVAVVAMPVARADEGPSEVVTRAGTDGQPPTFAYYYIWYQPTSWQRAKKDYPLLGRYSSDDPVVMQRHVAMAKAAGLTGFLVSWKGTNDLDARLDSLVRTSQRQDFKLEIVYQGLDFERNPLPVPQIAKDLKYFADRYEGNPVFDTFSKPVVVITGTEKFTVAQLQRATAKVKDQLLVLASAKDAEEYQRTASVLDGDAYYWSSSDPSSTLYAEKTQEMSEIVHRDKGLWFAPAPAGFDARLIGGELVVPRNGGDTLRTALQVARQSNPDAVAVISWNEYSENSHVEPSQVHGDQELTVLADVLGGKVVVPAGLTPTDTLKRNTGLTGWGALLGLLLVGALLNLALTLRRRRTTDPPDPPDPLATYPNNSDGPPGSVSRDAACQADPIIPRR